MFPAVEAGLGGWGKLVADKQDGRNQQWGLATF